MGSAVREERILREQMQARLEALRREFETGQTELQRVEAQRAYLHEAILRISGGIQILEELLEGEPAGQNGTVTGEKQSDTTQADGDNV